MSLNYFLVRLIQTPFCPLDPVSFLFYVHPSLHFFLDLLVQSGSLDAFEHAMVEHAIVEHEIVELAIVYFVGEIVFRLYKSSLPKQLS